MGTRVIRRFIPLALLVLAGCSLRTNATAEAEPVEAALPQHATAILSCTINGTSIGVSACLVAGGSTSVSGGLKVRNAGTSKQYTDYDLVRENGRTFELPLTAPFEIAAQANSESGYVLHLEIEKGAKTVFQDEAIKFGMISVDSDSLAS